MKNKLITSALAITIISASGKVLGLFREGMIAAYFGASVSSDAYKLAFSVPDVFAAIISAAISQTFIPIYVERLREGKNAQQFINNIFTLIALVAIVVVLIGMLSSSFIISFIAPGFDANTVCLAINLTKIMMPGSFFLIISLLVAGYLQTHDRFIAPALTWYSFSIIIMGSMFFFHDRGVIVLAWGTAVAQFSMLLIQLPSLFKQGFQYRPRINIKDESIKKMGFLVGPVIISSSFNQVYYVINRMLASGLAAGSISALDYASRINGLIHNIFILSIATVVYPSIARASEDTARFRLLIGRELRIAALICLPLSALLMVLRIPIVQLVFQRGAFDHSATIFTASALSGLSVGIIGIAYRELLNRAFYSLQNTRTPMWNGIIAIGLNIGLNIIFVRYWGITGLALGTAIAAILSGAMLLIRLKLNLGSIGGRWIAEGFIKSLLASFLLGLSVYWMEKFMISSFHLYGTASKLCVNLLITGGIGLVVYVLVMLHLGSEEINEGFNILRKRFAKII